MLTKRIKIIIIVLVSLLIGGSAAFFYFTGASKIEYVTEKVKRGNLIQTVSETGAVKSASEIDLNFLNSGRLANVLVKVGDKVIKDQILAELDYSGLVIKRQEAEANLNIAQANLNKLLAGSTSQEIAVAQASVNEAESSYWASIQELDKVKKVVAENIKQAQKNLNDLESGASANVTTYAQSVSNKESVALTTIETKLVEDNTAIDAINTVVTNTDSSDILSIKNLSYLNNTKDSYNQAVLLANSANTSLSVAKSNQTEDNINKALADAKIALNKTLEGLNNCFNALENTITTTNFTQTELDSAKTSINTQLTTVNSGISSIQTADNNLKDARITLDNAILTAQNSLNTAKISGEKDTTVSQNKVSAALKAWEAAKASLTKVKAPARREDVALNEAQVRQAQAALDSAKKQIENSIIKAPIDGQVTKVNYEVGEEAAGKGAVISILGVNNFEVESLISESDIAKVTAGDEVKITLDAFGDDIEFPGKVYFIEPAETEIQDVVYYKVKIEFILGSKEFKDNEIGIKSGMTANIAIKTFEKDNILIMPMRAVISKNDQGKFVKILEGKEVKEAPVKIGLFGDEGMVEVLSGVNEGDEVVTFTKTK